MDAAAELLAVWHIFALIVVAFVGVLSVDYAFSKKPAPVPKRTVGYVHVSCETRSGKGWCDTEEEAREKLRKLQNAKLPSPLNASSHAALVRVVLKNAADSPFARCDEVLVSGQRCRATAHSVADIVKGGDVKCV